jgi:hypothetical protein
MSFTNTAGIVRARTFLTSFSLALLLLAGCASPRPAAADGAPVEHASADVIAAERMRVPAPGRMILEPIEGPVDTVDFHIGSPLFLRLRIGDEAGCTPGTGEFFYFDAPGAQLGWSFQEVVDSLLFPPVPGRCERIIMLSSEASNRLAAGRFTMRSELFLAPKHRLGSDTIALHPVRSASGADEQSYARFLMEQIVRSAAHLRDPETVAALFGEGVPTSAESEVYRAVVLYRNGDYAGATYALRSSRDMERERRRPVNVAAARTRSTLEETLAQMLNPNR